MNSIILKNVLLHVLLLPFYFLTVREVSQLPEEALSTLLLFVGLIVIAPITSAFAYTYNTARIKKAVSWGHVTTFFSMLVVGAMLIILDVLLVEMIGEVFIFRFALLLFWVALIAYDFADYLTSHNVK